MNVSTMNPSLVIALVLVSTQCFAAKVAWEIDAKVLASTSERVEVPSNSVALSPAPPVPYELRFEALIPGAGADLPDYGTPQVWFSVDYRGAQDQVAFALRGGRLQDAIAYDFCQRGWAGPITEQFLSRENGAFNFRFSRMPDRATAPISTGKWVTVTVRVGSKEAELWVNGKHVLAVDRKHGEKSSIALGGSWQANTFRKVEVQPLGENALRMAISSPIKQGRADNEKRRQENRVKYQPKVLPEARSTGSFEISLDGEWLFMPADRVDPEAAPAPDKPDTGWHSLPVPGFWNPVGWWIFGQDQSVISRVFLYQELARCERFTFDWRNTASGWYRKHVVVPASYAGKRVAIEFSGVASVCEVYVNGTLAGSNMGMFKPFRVNLSSHLRAGEENLIAVWVANGQAKAPGGGRTEIAVTMLVSRDMVTELPKGIYSSPRAEDGKPASKRQGGIWQPVKLRVGSDIRLDEVWPRTTAKTLKLHVRTQIPSGSAESTYLGVCLSDTAEKIVFRKTIPWNEVMTASGVVQFSDLPVDLWSPESPKLYNLKLTLTQKDEIQDQRDLKIGFRDFAIHDGVFELNGKPWRFLGANMPPHGLHPNDKEFAKKFVGFMRQGNQRALRAVCSPFPAEWLDETDRQGVAVSYEGEWPWVMIEQQEIPDQTSLKAWKEEWIALVKANRHRPSILMWTINNENYVLGDKSVERRQRKWDIWQDIVKATREADPTRPIVLWSGYTRSTQGSLMVPLAGSKDDGDIDDRHIYTGTYTPSTIGIPAAFWRDSLKSLKTPGRPFISQEAGTAYTDTDLGHQELKYLHSWHGQTWTGRQGYPNVSPAFYLSRTARITKEQLEIIRRENVQGWLAFCTATWYHNVDSAKLMAPYSIHESVRLALQPHLVAVLRPPQRVFEGTSIPLNLFAVNDAENRIGTEWITEISLEPPEGSPLGSAGRLALEEPMIGGGVREGRVTLAIKDLKLAKRTNAVLHLITKDASGRFVCENRYEIAIFPKAPANPLGVVPVIGPKSAIDEWKPRLQALGIGVGGDPSKAALALAPGKAEWPEIIRQAEAGSRILVLDPQELPESPRWRGAKLGGSGWQGEVADFTEAGNKLGLGAGLAHEDMAWWQGSGPELFVYHKALTFAEPLSDEITPLVDHTPPHDYSGKWKMDFSLIRFPFGKGEILVCTLNFQGTDRDPAPNRVLRNLIKTILPPVE